MNFNAVETDDFDPFAGGELSGVFPTSEAQREVWFADRLSAQASLAFNESTTLNLHGPLDLAALAAAMKKLVIRHDALRCAFGAEGTEQYVGGDVDFAMAVVDLQAMSPKDAHGTLAQATSQQVETPFDLERGALWRATLYRLAPDEHALLMTAHHIVCDGWSWGVLISDLGKLYAEQTGLGPGPEPAPSYADYVQWELDESSSEAMRGHEAYWVGQFTGTLPVLDLPTDRLRPNMRSFASRRIDHLLSDELLADVRRTAAGQGVSYFATLLAGFAALLSRLTGQDDLVIGVPAAGQSSSGLASLVGHCVNLLPIRVQVDAALPFADVLQQTGSRLLDAFEHQTLTYGTLLKLLKVERDPKRLPLVSVMFNLDQAVKGLRDAFPELDVSLAVNPRHFENFEVFVNAVPADGGLRLECQYNTDLFDEATVVGWLESYEQLLRSVARDVRVNFGAVEWLPPQALARVKALQPLPTPIPQADLMHSAFVRQCKLTPERVAISDGSIAWRYAELDARSNRLAHRLRDMGVRRGHRVGLCLARNADMVTALLAVLKAGGTYVPLDPAFPPDRLAYYAEDAALALLVLDTASEAVAPKQWRSDASDRLMRLDDESGWLLHSEQALPAGPDDALPDSAAYVIYTSGSTGRPKGVCVTHRSVVNFIGSMQSEPGLGPDDRLAAVTTLSFDIAVLEWLLPLAVGGQLIVVPREIVLDGERLGALLRAENVTAMQATPSLWRMLLDTAWMGGPRFKALVGGESFPPDLARQLLDRTGEVWNLYGPTETTIWSTAWRVQRAWLLNHAMPIGKPIANTTVWVLDEHGRSCPVGVAGELCIGGDGVALGYLDRPDLTSDRFVADPFSPSADARLYRTGDRGRWHVSGLLEHLGRLDFQVKVRGYRIELGEIESLCSGRCGVGQCVVLAREDEPGDVRLVAYLTPSNGVEVDEAALREHLGSKLPEYMLPQHLVRLDAIPLLPNGKVDRRALPPPDAAAMRSIDRVAPRNELEATVLAAMEEVLKLPGLGVHDGFFALGGHSLLAARLTARLNRSLEVNLPMSTLFDAPTAEKLAAAIDAMKASSAPRRHALVPQPGRRSAPLTPMQERIRFVQEMHPGRVLYNTPSAHRLTGPMDLAAFEAAIREVVRRQPALRTRIDAAAMGGRGTQQVAELVEFDLPVEDLSGLAPELREAELLRRMQQVVDLPLDIHQAPLFRVALYRLAPEQHALLFMPHHIVWDGWSFDIFYEDVSAIYGAFLAGQASPLPPLTVTYGDYAEWYLDWLDGPQAAEQMQFWVRRFARAPASAAPWADRPRSAGMTGLGATEYVSVELDVVERLREIARNADVTLSMLTFAAYVAMMADVFASPSLVVAMPVRGRLMPELEPVMGFFNNLLPLPLTVDNSQPWSSFLKTVRAEVLDAMAHQDVAFERMAQEPGIAAHATQAGLYQALFSFQDARERNRQWGLLRHEQIPIFQKGATEDLGLWLMEAPEGVHGGFTYNADIYSAPTAKMLRQRYVELLVRLSRDPSSRLIEWLDGAGSEAAAYLRERRSGAAASAAAVAAISALAASPQSDTEVAMSDVWESVLGMRAGAHDNFFDIGGNSLMAMALIDGIERRFGRRLRPPVILEAPTISQLAAVLDHMGGSHSIVKLRSGAGRPAVFLVHDADGEVLLYRNLAQRLHPAHPVYGIQPHFGADQVVQHTDVSDMVAHYVERIRSVQPHGPYILGGLCAGGTIAFELARVFQEQGEAVTTLALFDAADMAAPERQGEDMRKRMRRVTQALRTHAQGGFFNVVRFAPSVFIGGMKGYIGYKASTLISRVVVRAKVSLLAYCLTRKAPLPRLVQGVTVRQVLSCSIRNLAGTGRLTGEVHLFRATRSLQGQADEPYSARFEDPLLGWPRRVQGQVIAIDVAGGHSTMLQEPQVASLAERLQACIDARLPALP